MDLENNRWIRRCSVLTAIAGPLQWKIDRYSRRRKLESGFKWNFRGYTLLFLTHKLPRARGDFSLKKSNLPSQ
ncbi:hypothetical protein HAX54_015502, partial [Datura stramonium]|nr:hypothetical protein [Datura stramonium]